jgi:hypothetical protein
MPEKYSGPWIAEFREGKRDGDMRYFGHGPIWRTIVVAPLPNSDRWFLCGGDGIPPASFPDEIEEWPEQIRYTFQGTIRMRDGLHAIYLPEE